MIEAVVGLLMFGKRRDLKEARLQPSMAICLRGKLVIIELFQSQLHINVGKVKQLNIDG